MLCVGFLYNNREYLGIRTKQAYLGVSGAKQVIWRITRSAQMFVYCMLKEHLGTSVTGYWRKLTFVSTSLIRSLTFRCLLSHFLQHLVVLLPGEELFVCQGELSWQGAIEAGLLFWAPEVTCFALLLTQKA